MEIWLVVLCQRPCLAKSVRVVKRVKRQVEDDDDDDDDDACSRSLGFIFFKHEYGYIYCDEEECSTCVCFVSWC